MRSHCLLLAVLQHIASTNATKTRMMQTLRACRLLESPPSAADAAEAAAEAATLVDLLESRVGALAATLDGAFPELRATVWQSESSTQAAVQVGGWLLLQGLCWSMLASDA